MTDVARRKLLVGLAAAGGFALVGCDRSEKKASPRASSSSRAPSPSTQAARKEIMTIYRNPNCGCCEDWAKIAKNAGYQITLVDSSTRSSMREKYAVPKALASCHTAVVGGYAIEGHVPMEAIARLLDSNPPGIKGIAVAGMPRGSPGMEVPNGRKDPFAVMAFDAAGRTFVYQS